jgi:hypothetical protein
MSKEVGERDRTLSHEILQVMPLDVVGQIPHIDTTVLLGRISNTLHHRLLVASGVGACASATRSVRLIASRALSTTRRA